MVDKERKKKIKNKLILVYLNLMDLHKDELVTVECAFEKKKKNSLIHC